MKELQKALLQHEAVLVTKDTLADFTVFLRYVHEGMFYAAQCKQAAIDCGGFSFIQDSWVPIT